MPATILHSLTARLYCYIQSLLLCMYIYTCTVYGPGEMGLMTGGGSFVGGSTAEMKDAAHPRT